MNFIVEILPTKEDGKDFVYVVRAQNGYPIAVCESLDEAKIVISEKHDEFLAQARKNS